MIDSDIVHGPALHERRPPALQEKIARDFEWLQRSMYSQGKLYEFNGEGGDYEFHYSDDEHSVWAGDILDYIAKEKQAPLRVLDLGTGAGVFVLATHALGHIGQGITAHDYRFAQDETRIDSPDLTDEIYLVGDMQDMNGIPGVGDQYDLIVSQFALMHLIDPLAAIEQAANRVARGGVFAASQLLGYKTYPYTMRPDSHMIRRAFEEAGFTADFSLGIPLENPTRSLVMQRIHDDTPLRFPVDYDFDE